MLTRLNFNDLYIIIKRNVQDSSKLVNKIKQNEDLIIGDAGDVLSCKHKNGKEFNAIANSR